MPFKNLPFNLVAPPDTTSGARIEIGPDNIPSVLQTFYTTGIYAGANGVVSGIIFYGTGTAFTYDILLDWGDGSAVRALGSYDGSTVQEKLYHDDTINGGLWATEVNYETASADPTAGNRTSLSLVNSWLHASNPATIRRVAVPPEGVFITGRITSGTTTNGILIATVDAIFRPVHDQQFPVCNNASGNNVIGNLAPNGQLKIFGTFGNDLAFNSVIGLD
jgi:hypothetical protein